MKLYIVTREDLSPGMRVAQSCHALRSFAAIHPMIDSSWYEQSNNLVALEVSNEQELRKLVDLGWDKGLSMSIFQEPDLDNAVTAVAFEPKAGRWLSHLPLACSKAA